MNIHSYIHLDYLEFVFRSKKSTRLGNIIYNYANNFFLILFDNPFIFIDLSLSTNFLNYYTK